MRRPLFAAGRGQLAAPSAPAALQAGFPPVESLVAAQQPRRHTVPKFVAGVPSCGDCPRGRPRDRCRPATAEVPTTRCRTDPPTRFRKSGYGLAATPASPTSPPGARCIERIQASTAEGARHAEYESPPSPWARMASVAPWAKYVALYLESSRRCGRRLCRLPTDFWGIDRWT